eukprot:348419-Amorphochlora_amoeboformis.AAC.1
MLRCISSRILASEFAKPRSSSKNSIERHSHFRTMVRTLEQMHTSYLVLQANLSTFQGFELALLEANVKDLTRTG